MHSRRVFCLKRMDKRGDVQKFSSCNFENCIRVRAREDTFEKKKGRRYFRIYLFIAREGTVVRGS